MQLTKTDRVYLNDLKMYGNVVRVGFLGLKSSSSVVILTDNGIMKAYAASQMSCIIPTSTKTNSMGETFDIPLDLKTIGSSILSEQGVPKIKQIMIFSKYLELQGHEQLKYCNKWNTISSGSHSEKTTFIMDIYNELCT